MTLGQGYDRHVGLEAELLVRHRWSPEQYEYAHVALDPSLSAPEHARGWVTTYGADAALVVPEQEIVALIVTELVTNAVRHVPGPQQDLPSIEVHFGIADTALRLEVCDPGAGFTVGALHPPVAELPGRRGLVIVDALASRWGAGLGSRCHCVWAEVDRPVRWLHAV